MLKIIKNFFNLKKTVQNLVGKNPPEPNDPITKWAKAMKSHLSEEDMPNSNKHTKIYSTLLAIREMQIKTSLRYHFTPTKTTKIKMGENTKCWQGCGESGSPLAWLVEMSNGMYHFGRNFGKLLQLKARHETTV